MTTTNELTKNYSGIFGNHVRLRNRNGVSIMTIPLKKPRANPTANQLNARRKFQLAAHYAKNILQDPDKLATYMAKSRNGLAPYIMALTDYLKPPFVEQIDASRYQGNPGDKIGVTAIDDFELTEVRIKIVDPGNAVIEQGPCVFDQLTGNYHYTATVQVSDISGVTIIATATDTPGHSAELSVTL